MKTTRLMAFAILLTAVALVPSASALCAEKVCLAFAIDLPREVIGDLIGQPIPDPVDNDNDGYPDYVEVQLCSRQALRDLVNTDTVPGQCLSTTDYVGVDTEDFVDNIRDFVDEDKDFVPEALEPSLCLVESEGDPSDGTCSADNQDYDPPL